MEVDLASSIVLRPGVEIPRVGLGVFRAGAGTPTQNSVKWAIAAGYRHIDTAAVYGNERDVGQAIRDCGVPREQIFVTTKLWNADQGHDETLRAFDRSFEALGLPYIDLYLMHWPVPDKRLASWRAMQTLQGDGRCRAIGVSNFTEAHLEQLLLHANVPPAVNQVELSPFLQQRELVHRCRELGIVVEAYSPLTRGQRLEDRRLRMIADAVQRSPAQVLIRWGLQKDFVVLPKSTTKARIEENAQVFDFRLSPELMARLDELDENLRVAWDPTQVE
jgi:diketogulonate reductase-like aldo/keto reductase